MSKLLLTILSSILLSSCTRYYYYPTYQTQIKIEKKNEIQATVFSDVLNQGLSVNYSITQNIGAGIIHNNFNEAKLTDIYPIFYKSFKQTKNSSINISFIPAYCFGKLQFDDLDLKINRLYFQPTFCFTSKYFDFGASYRYSLINYTVAKSINNPQAYLEKFNKQYDFNEASLSIAAGIPFIKLQLTYNTISEYNGVSLNSIPETLYIGLLLKQNLNKLFSKKENSD